ncbi:unnamed protein product [Brachionus calyciflorus]|uniref:MULE transposase domain-containing protein n=1 Tax=Brachionus calyciflorus TaxID=104777 RepID=A0A813M7M8_9BILA|nr:unnamed protein product [Brachionus calyciflorus]
MSPIGIKNLQNSNRWHFDGTFKTCTRLFYQVLSVHGNYQNRILPASYILLQNKEQDTYIERLSKLKEVLLKETQSPLSFDEALYDFEKAMLNGIEAYFVNNWLKGPYGLYLNHYENNGPRTNNRLEGYHSKLSRFNNLKPTIYDAINIIKSSASEVYTVFHDIEREPIDECSGLSKDRKKDKTYIEFQDQYNRKLLTFTQFFEKLAFYITHPCGLKAQIHCYKSFILNEIPVQDNLLTSLQQLTLKLSKQEDEVQFIKTVEYTNYERPQKSMDISDVPDSTINGLLSTNIYLLERPMFNPDVLLENIFIQVVHAQNHWNSLNSPNYYLQKIKHFLKLINGGSNYMTICIIPVVQQIEYDDCGLFALGYALALALDIDPGSIYFDQSKTSYKRFEKQQHVFLQSENKDPKKNYQQMNDLDIMGTHSELIKRLNEFETSNGLGIKNENIDDQNFNDVPINTPYVEMESDGEINEVINANEKRKCMRNWSIDGLTERQFSTSYNVSSETWVHDFSYSGVSLIKKFGLNSNLFVLSKKEDETTINLIITNYSKIKNMDFYTLMDYSKKIQIILIRSE